MRGVCFCMFVYGLASETGPQQKQQNENMHAPWCTHFIDFPFCHSICSKRNFTIAVAIAISAVATV